MKTLALVTCLFLFKVSCGQQWCPKGAQWTYNYSAFSVGEGYNIVNYEKDTVINSLPCKKISTKGIVLDESIPQPYWYLDTFLSVTYTFARNDSVFFWQDGFSSFSPIYFFNAHVGDTVSFFSQYSCRNPLKQLIDSTGVIQINNQSLRYYVASIIDSGHYPQVPVIKVVERIGAPDDFMNPLFYCPVTDGETYTLRCYQDDSFSLYQTDTAIACDYLFTSVKNETFNTSITLFPNPTSQSFELLLSELPAGETNFQLYNGLGQLVMQRRIIVANTALNKENLSNGVYFWQLEANGQILKRGKVVFD